MFIPNSLKSVTKLWCKCRDVLHKQQADRLAARAKPCERMWRRGAAFGRFGPQGSAVSKWLLWMQQCIRCATKAHSSSRCDALAVSARRCSDVNDSSTLQGVQPLQCFQHLRSSQFEMSDHVSLQLFQQRCSAAIAAAETCVDSKIHHLVASARAVQHRRNRATHVGTNDVIFPVNQADRSAWSTTGCTQVTEQVHWLLSQGAPRRCHR